MTNLSDTVSVITPSANSPQVTCPNLTYNNKNTRQRNVIHCYKFLQFLKKTVYKIWNSRADMQQMTGRQAGKHRKRDRQTGRGTDGWTIINLTKVHNGNNNIISMSYLRELLEATDCCCVALTCCCLLTVTVSVTACTSGFLVTATTCDPSLLLTSCSSIPHSMIYIT